MGAEEPAKKETKAKGKSKKDKDGKDAPKHETNGTHKTSKGTKSKTKEPKDKKLSLRGAAIAILKGRKNSMKPADIVEEAIKRKL
jgi:hypothetical protein